MHRWILPAVSVTACLLSVAALVPPALAATVEGVAATSSERPSVRLVGEIATEGLPATASLSPLRVVNDGEIAIRWTVRGTLTGDAASAAVIEVLAPVAGTCSATGEPLTGWSPAALAPGATAVVCVRVSTSAPAAGTVVPTVTVDAHAA